MLLLVLAICALLPSLSRRFPLDVFIYESLLAFCGAAILLYIGHLVVLGWLVDLLTKIEELLADIGMPKIKARPAPLEYEQVGEIIVVTLRDNIVTIRQCQTVERQLKHLIAGHHCDFILDFLYAQRISTSFHAAMVHVMKAARREAARLGKPYRPVALSHGAAFRVFDDRQRAVAEMSRHDGHGWVVLSSVPVGTRAVFD
ncbi:MAG: hypothetical protein ABSF26_24400 [Thermoguttaceae bacterium]